MHEYQNDWSGIDTDDLTLIQEVLDDNADGDDVERICNEIEIELKDRGFDV